jgi:predicted nucleic acid-binding protein
LALIAGALEEFLERHSKIGIDTSVFIFKVEAHAKYQKLVDNILRWVESSKGKAVTSTLTMLEVLVQPYRVSDMVRVNKFYALLSTYPHLEWKEPSLELVDVAARPRAEYRLKTPDAIHVATAMVSGATGLVSKDPELKKVKGLDFLILDEICK